MTERPTDAEILAETLSAGDEGDHGYEAVHDDEVCIDGWYKATPVLDAIRAQVWREARDEAARFVAEPYNAAAVLMAIFNTKAGEGIS